MPSEVDVCKIQEIRYQISCYNARSMGLDI